MTIVYIHYLHQGLQNGDLLLLSISSGFMSWRTYKEKKQPYLLTLSVPVIQGTIPLTAPGCLSQAGTALPTTIRWRYAMLNIMFLPPK